ncbi:RHS repeat-associated core domain-containing protein [Flavobacterium supellecticarium]|uniref:RHS repeat-associated core domain-containing protein n=1 Tax=Flavobacterium supellecticarium TaxID=2565924 RepID=A0A4S3ZSE9_9FLAO|nr:RHS repeat-associated core domain-containing protein [Flavobacterium supellecticarium]
MFRYYQGGNVVLSNLDGYFIEKRLFDPWGKLLKVQDEKGHQLAGLTLLDRGYTGHEHLQSIGIINMNGRIYDPKLRRFLSPDNYVQDPYNTQNYNRYGYCWNNPLKYTDPDGEFIFTALACIIPGGQVFLPWAIGADIGMWSGGSIANGTTNPFKWDYSSGKTWAYMTAGAVVGSISGGTGSIVASSGMPMANTAAIASASFINSLGTSIYTGCQTPVSVSLGVASYDFTNGSWGYLGKKGNKWYENVGYGLGAIANFNDAMVGFSSKDIGSLELTTEHSDTIGHSALVEPGTVNNNSSIVSFGPPDQDFSLNPFKSVRGSNNWMNHTSDGSPLWRSTISGVNKSKIHSYGMELSKNPPKYNVYFSSCVTHTSRVLNMSGFLNIGIHPYILHAQVYLRGIGFRTYLSHYLTR